MVWREQVWGSDCLDVIQTQTWSPKRLQNTIINKHLSKSHITHQWNTTRRIQFRIPKVWVCVHSKEYRNIRRPHTFSQNQFRKFSEGGRVFNIVNRQQNHAQSHLMCSPYISILSACIKMWSVWQVSQLTSTTLTLPQSVYSLCL